jgi:hypothetical protein
VRKRTTSTTRFSCLLAMAAFAPVAISCLGSDPVHDAEVTALGGEVDGIPVGQYHRAGQPCTVCHGPQGPASTQFSLAGTVFNAPGSLVGIDKAQVLLIDASGSSPTSSIETNCVGNFFVSPDLWTPAFPVLVGLQSGTVKTQMTTQISRATSCAECHADPPGLSAVGHVYLQVAVNPDEEAKCPVSPNAGSELGAVPP